MGHDLSRIVDTLHPVAKNERLAALGELLKDRKFCKNLAKGAKQTELGISISLKSTPAKAKPAHSTSLQPSRTVDSTVLENWSKDLSIFWVTAQFQLAPGEEQFAAFYDDTLQFETRHAFDGIRLRFRKLFYHDLLCFLNPQASNKTTSKVYDQLAKITARKSRIAPEADVRSNIEAWVRAGRRYHKLTTTFGNAILFVLPDSYSTDYLEKRLPLDDKAYQTAVQRLVPLKGHINELSNAEEVAKKLRQTILEPFKFLETELSVLTDGKGPPPQYGYRQCTPDLMFNRPSHDQGRVPNFAGLLGPYDDQARVHETAISADVRITDIENESEFQQVSDDYSLDYYTDPCFLDEAHSLEYYLNVHTPGQSPVA